MADDTIDRLFDEAFKLNEEYDDMLRKRAAIRGSLRNLRDAGVMSDAQSEQLDELFPPIQRTRGNTPQEGEE